MSPFRYLCSLASHCCSCTCLYFFVLCPLQGGVCAHLPFSVETTVIGSITVATLRYYFCYEKRMLTKRGLLMKTFFYSIKDTCYGWPELNHQCSMSDNCITDYEEKQDVLNALFLYCIMKISDNSHPFKSTDLWKIKHSDNLPKHCYSQWH